MRDSDLPFSPAELHQVVDEIADARARYADEADLNDGTGLSGRDVLAQRFGQVDRAEADAAVAECAARTGMPEYRVRELAAQAAGVPLGDIPETFELCAGLAGMMSDQDEIVCASTDDIRAEAGGEMLMLSAESPEYFAGSAGQDDDEFAELAAPSAFAVQSHYAKMMDHESGRAAEEKRKRAQIKRVRNHGPKPGYGRLPGADDAHEVTEGGTDSSQPRRGPYPGTGSGVYGGQPAGDVYRPALGGQVPGGISEGAAAHPEVAAMFTGGTRHTRSGRAVRVPR